MVLQWHTNAAKTYGLCSEEHEIVAVLHAGNDTISIEVLLYRGSEGFVICFWKLNSATIILTYHLQQLYRMKIINILESFTVNYRTRYIIY